MPQITRDYQEGTCSICQQETLVRVLVNNKKAALVCRNCIKEIGDMTVNELLNKFGEDISLNAS